jgi:CubicO group peptidase (beta-lactamase class C family)
MRLPYDAQRNVFRTGDRSNHQRDRVTLFSHTGVKPRCVVALFVCIAAASFGASFAERPLPVIRPATVGMSSQRLDRIVPGMQGLIDADKIPGTVTLVARRGKIVHFQAAGHRNIEADQPMTRDTIFRLYSQSKPLTGVATLILFEEGHFLLTDPISDYLPEFANMRVYVGVKEGEIETEEAQPITIQHLLTHTSGLTYDFFATPVAKMYEDAGVTGVAQGSRFESLEQWSQALAKLPLVAQPGTEWNYSVGMDVLGRLVEVVSGKSFRTFLNERIFNPLDKTVELMMMDHLNPEFPPDPLTSLYSWLGSRQRAWGLGFGLTGSVVTDPALTGLPGSKGVFSWGGAATTHFWVDPQEDLVGIVHTQLLPDGTYPVRQLMQLLTYQAIID